MRARAIFIPPSFSANGVRVHEARVYTDLKDSPVIGYGANGRRIVFDSLTTFLFALRVDARVCESWTSTSLDTPEGPCLSCRTPVLFTSEGRCEKCGTKAERPR